MVAINPKKNSHFGENPPEINLNSNLKRWFSRNIGLWKSNRTYFLDEAQKTYNLIMNINIQAPILVAGPFGTGKTRLLARAAYEILKWKKSRVHQFL